MGTDFLNRMKKSFHRALDRGEVALRTPTLARPRNSSRNPMPRCALAP